MDPAKQREIASKGGKSAHAQGLAHTFTTEEAREAGRKGGKSHTREHMSEIGRLGGSSRRRSDDGDQAAGGDPKGSEPDDVA